MIQTESELTAPDILAKVARIATLSRETYTGEDFEGHVKGLFTETYTNLFTQPEVITADSLRRLSTRSYLTDNSWEIRKAVAGIIVPGTDIPMFLHGGSYSLFSEDGQFYDFIEEREGAVYGTAENPHNAAPYAVSKPLALYMFRALGRELDISNQSNSDLLSDLLRKTVHMGGIEAKFPFTASSEMRQMIMGISSVELTPDALGHLLDTFVKAGAQHSIDDADKGHYTAAGFLDELAGRVAVAYLNGRRGNQLQPIANGQWTRLLTAGIPGPLPPQYN